MVKRRLHLHFDAVLNKDTCCKYVSTPKKIPTQKSNTLSNVDVAFARHPFGLRGQERGYSLLSLLCNGKSEV